MATDFDVESFVLDWSRAGAIKFWDEFWHWYFETEEYSI